MSKIFETPLQVSADTENRCFEIYDKNNDRVASGIEELEQAKVFAAAPEMCEALKDAVQDACGACAMMHVSDKYDFIENGCPFEENEDCKCLSWIRTLRKARGKSEANNG